MTRGRFGGGGHVPLLPPLGSGTVYNPTKKEDMIADKTDTYFVCVS